MFKLALPFVQIVIGLSRKPLLAVYWHRGLLAANDSAEVVHFSMLEIGVIGGLLAPLVAAIAWMYRSMWAAAMAEKDTHITRLEKKLDEQTIELRTERDNYKIWAESAQAIAERYLKRELEAKGIEPVVPFVVPTTHNETETIKSKAVSLVLNDGAVIQHSEEEKTKNTKTET